MRAIPAVLLACGLAVAAAAAPPPTATPAGPPVSCIPLARIDHSRVRDDRTIDFVGRGGRAWRNTLPQPCPELGFEQGFSYATALSRLCSTDIITVIEHGSPVRGASCGLGRFQPVTLAPAPRR